MLRGLWKLTWIEIKIFLREPLGAIGTIGIPVLVFLVAWGFAVMKITRYLGKKGELGEKYHELDPAAFDKDAKSNRPF